MRKRRTWKKMSKNRLQQIKFVYLERREKAKKTYPVGHKQRIRTLKQIRERIYQLNIRIRTIERQESATKALSKEIYAYSGIKIQNIGKYGNTQVLNAKRIFYKEGLERGIHGFFLSSFVGMAKKSRAAHMRKLFMSRSKHYEDVWYRWKDFLNREEM